MQTHSKISNSAQGNPHIKMSISDLSNELLFRIFELVPARPSRRHVVLVSRRFCAIATPLLYERFTESSPRSLELLLRTLLHNALLAKSIKRFICVPFYNESPMKSWTDGDFVLAQELVRDISLDDMVTEWMTSVRTGTTDALVGLVISMLANVE